MECVLCYCISSYQNHLIRSHDSVFTQKKVEPRRCLRGAVWKTAPFCKEDPFFSKKVKKALPKGHHFSKQLLKGAVLAPLFFLVYKAIHLQPLEILACKNGLLAEFQPRMFRCCRFCLMHS